MGRVRAATVVRRVLDLPGGFDAYQRVVGASRSKRTFMETFVRLRSGERVLDIGCGTGALCEYVPPGVFYLGVDVDEDYVEAARARYSPRCEFVCADAAGFRAEEHGRFDVAIAYGVLHHLDEHQAGEIIRMARAAVGRSGRVAVCEPVRTPDQGRLEAFIMRHDRGKFIRTKDEYVRLVAESFGQVDAEVVERTYRIPFTVAVLEARP